MKKIIVLSLFFIAGLRFEIQERMNLRIDFGVGLESNAFYISFNEAF